MQAIQIELLCIRYLAFHEILQLFPGSKQKLFLWLIMFICGFIPPVFQQAF